MLTSSRHPVSEFLQTTSCLVLAACIALHVTDARAEPVKCQDDILKQGAKYAQKVSKALAKCGISKIKGKLPPNTVCRTDPKVANTVAKAVAGLNKKIDKACGGADRICGGDLTDEDLPAALGWPPVCPNLENGACNNTISDCGDIAECLLCIQDAALDRTTELNFQFLEPAAPGSDVAKCQQTLGKDTQKFLKTKSKELTKCWRARLKGSHADQCPDPNASPESPAFRAAIRIAQAETKLRDRLCQRCGGDDRACGGGDDLAPVDIGFQAVCDERTIPGGAGCAGPIAGLNDLVDCTACVSEFQIDCMDRALVPQFAAYPAECNPATPCATTLRLDADEDALDLDLGYDGLAHDNSGPFMKRLTLCLTDCVGSDCDLAGPVGNTGGAAFANQRCQETPWFACESEADCPIGGGPCRFYLGPPTPIDEGGVSLCMISEIAAPVTGTADTATGEISVHIDLDLDLDNANVVESTDEGTAHPCPPCVAGVCVGGTRDGMPCVPHGHSARYADDVSHDCPPGGGFILGAGSTTMKIEASTSPTSKTLTAASPSCRAPGTTGLKCFCDTCNNLSAEPCFTSADCPDSPAGTPGVCGGNRCLPPAPNAGTPCITVSGSSAECGGFPCGTIGQPKPNSCSPTAQSCSPNTPPDNASIDEGTCSTGPFPGRCSLQPFKSCVSTDDCTAPTCEWCSPGQVCSFTPRECYADNGTIGNGVSVGGTTEPPTSGQSDATLGALFCIRPTGSPLFDAPWGLPGLGRATIPVTATFE